MWFLCIFVDLVWILLYGASYYESHHFRSWVWLLPHGRAAEGVAPASRPGGRPRRIGSPVTQYRPGWILGGSHHNLLNTYERGNYVVFDDIGGLGYILLYGASY